MPTNLNKLQQVYSSRYFVTFQLLSNVCLLTASMFQCLYLDIHLSKSIMFYESENSDTYFCVKTHTLYLRNQTIVIRTALTKVCTK